MEVDRPLLVIHEPETEIARMIGYTTEKARLHRHPGRLLKHVATSPNHVPPHGDDIDSICIRRADDSPAATDPEYRL
jgi:hypothetical protein